ncbi:MAG: VOC family protein [Pyrinomonadaceae bacterium]
MSTQTATTGKSATAKFNPYLNFDGTTEEAFNFYKSVFGGDFMGGQIMRYKDMPDGDKMPPEDQNKVMHMGLDIGNGTYLMGTDTIDGFGPKLVMGNNSQIMISPESREEADRLFDGLSAGGNVVMPMADQFWGAYYGNFEDKFGVNWMIHYQTHQ